MSQSRRCGGGAPGPARAEGCVGGEWGGRRPCRHLVRGQIVEVGQGQACLPAPPCRERSRGSHPCCARGWHGGGAGGDAGRRLPDRSELIAVPLEHISANKRRSDVNCLLDSLGFVVSAGIKKKKKKKKKGDSGHRLHAASLETG